MRIEDSSPTKPIVQYRNQIGDMISLQMNEKEPGGEHFDKSLVMRFAGRGEGLAVAPKPTQPTCPFF